MFYAVILLTHFFVTLDNEGSLSDFRNFSRVGHRISFEPFTWREDGR